MEFKLGQMEKATIRKDVVELNNTINQWDLIDIHRHTSFYCVLQILCFLQREGKIFHHQRDDDSLKAQMMVCIF